MVFVAEKRRALIRARELKLFWGPPPQAGPQGRALIRARELKPPPQIARAAEGIVAP